VGLEYVGESLLAQGFPVVVVDLPFHNDWKKAIREGLGEPLAVGISVRNLDDCSMVSKRSFIPWLEEVVSYIKGLTEAPVILGGVGFSTSPYQVMERLGAHYGIWGDGEEAVVLIARKLSRGETITPIPGLIYHGRKGLKGNGRAKANLSHFPPPRRQLFDNFRYEREGGMVGVETKRGCSQGCIYCADPVAKGRRIRLRPPDSIVTEILDLLHQGVSWLHLCDSEFNLPPEHAKAICNALIEQGIADRVCWYCYCSPVPFDRELGQLMKRAGCAGINFGVDSLDKGQLSRLGRQHCPEDVANLVEILHNEGLNFMFDLLLGAPGESEETVKATINLIRRLQVPLVGVAVGVRVYPGTPLGKLMAQGLLNEGLSPQGIKDLTQPLFYISPKLGSAPFELIRQLVEGDRRFLLLSLPGEEAAYNYADDDSLCSAIEQGARGAYWDILRKQVLNI
jgi:radical SAM superfamily enzyme YgiQ (UPF0313 family)